MVFHLRKYRTLKHLEEYEQEVQLSEYDMSGAHLAQTYRGYQAVYSLFVEGLIEGRPSVIMGDKIIVSKANAQQRFEGRVIEIQQSNVVLLFNDRFPHSSFGDSDRFDVMFRLQRKPLNAAHRALEFMGTQQWVPLNLAQNLLFPKLDRPLALQSIMFAMGAPINPQLNTQQRQAVQHVLSGNFRPFPYVILGPPGEQTEPYAAANEQQSSSFCHNVVEFSPSCALFCLLLF